MISHTNAAKTKTFSVKELAQVENFEALQSNFPNDAFPDAPRNPTAYYDLLERIAFEAIRTDNHEGVVHLIKVAKYPHMSTVTYAPGYNAFCGEILIAAVVNDAQEVFDKVLSLNPEAAEYSRADTGVGKLSVAGIAATNKNPFYVKKTIEAGYDYFKSAINTNHLGLALRSGHLNLLLDAIDDSTSYYTNSKIDFSRAEALMLGACQAGSLAALNQSFTLLKNSILNTNLEFLELCVSAIPLAPVAGRANTLGAFLDFLASKRYKFLPELGHCALDSACRHSRKDLLDICWKYLPEVEEPKYLRNTFVNLSRCENTAFYKYFLHKLYQNAAYRTSDTHQCLVELLFQEARPGNKHDLLEFLFSEEFNDIISKELYELALQHAGMADDLKCAQFLIDSGKRILETRTAWRHLAKGACLGNGIQVLEHVDAVAPSSFAPSSFQLLDGKQGEPLLQSAINKKHPNLAAIDFLCNKKNIALPPEANKETSQRINEYPALELLELLYNKPLAQQILEDTEISQKEPLKPEIKDSIINLQKFSKLMLVLNDSANQYADEFREVLRPRTNLSEQERQAYDQVLVRTWIFVSNLNNSNTAYVSSFMQQWQKQARGETHWQDILDQINACWSYGDEALPDVQQWLSAFANILAYHALFKEMPTTKEQFLEYEQIARTKTLTALAQHHTIIDLMDCAREFKKQEAKLLGLQTLCGPTAWKTPFQRTLQFEELENRNIHVQEVATRNELFSVGAAFDNCLFSSKDEEPNRFAIRSATGQSYVYAFWKNDQPYAVIEVALLDSENSRSGRDRVTTNFGDKLKLAQFQRPGNAEIAQNDPEYFLWPLLAEELKKLDFSSLPLGEKFSSIRPHLHYKPESSIAFPFYRKDPNTRQAFHDLFYNLKTDGKPLVALKEIIGS